MDNEQEYITLTQVAKDLGWNKATVYDWIKTLDLKTHKFVRNRNTFLHIADVDRLKEIKAKPWTAGPNTARTARNTPEKEKKPSAPQTMQPVSERPKRHYVTSEDIPAGWVLCSDFFRSYGVKETTQRRWLTNGIEGETFEFEEKDRPGRSDKFRYFTPTQQEKALDILRRYGKLK